METETLRAVRRALRWLKKAERLLAQDLRKQKNKHPIYQEKKHEPVSSENEWREQP